MIIYFRHSGILFTSIFLCFFFSIQSVFCQVQTDPYIVEKIPLHGKLHGLSGRCIIQDTHGFMWFGTNNGLLRYDGTEFKQFLHDPDDSTSISCNRILGIIDDGKGGLLIATEKGVDKYQTSTGKIIRYHKSPYVPEHIAEGLLRSDNQGFSGCLWIGTDKTTNIYTPDQEIIESLKMRFTLWQDPQICKDLFGIMWDPPGGMWVKFGDRQLCRINTGTGTADTVITVPSAIIDQLVDSKNRFWVTTEEGLYLFNPRQYSFTRILNQAGDPNRLQNQMVRAIQEDRNGNLWIRTLDGLYMYNGELELQFKAEHEEVYQHSFENIHLTGSIYEDRSGIIWYYTPDYICKCYPKQHQFNALTDPQNISSICEDHNGNILFGSESLYHYDIYQNTCKKLSYRVPGSEFYQLGIESLLYDKQKQILWAGSNNGGLYKILFMSDSIHDIKWYGQLYGEEPGKNNSPLLNLLQDNNEKIWIRGRNRLPILFDPVDEQVWQLYSGPPGEVVLEADSRILYEHTNGALLILGKNGLYRFHPPFKKMADNIIAPDSITCLLNIKLAIGQILDKKITCSYMDSEKGLWLGTSSWDLIRIEGAGDLNISSSSIQLLNYKASEGLPNNAIYSMMEDLHGNLWIGTEFGLSRMILTSENFTTYNMLHGLPSSEFTSESALRSENGMLFFGTRGGLVYFNPDSSGGNEVVPEVLITSLKIHNNEISPEENPSMNKLIFLMDTLALKSHQNHLSFEFAALNYIMPHNNQYKYMLEGIDEDWVYSGNRNYTNYNDLKPGKYTFRVTASNNNGLWNPAGKSIYIIIPRPWYQKTLALFMWGFMLIMAISAFIRIRTRRLSRDKVRLEIEVETRINEIQWMNDQIIEMETMKTRFFNNISHEFRNLISLIKVPVECLREEGKLSKKCSMKLDAIRRNTNKMASLVNQLLDISKIDKGNLELKLSRSNVCDFVHAIAVSYTSLAETKGIQYRYVLSRNDCLEMFDEDKLEKIINNLLSNAFKFTDEGGKVILGLKRKSQENGFEETLEITVADTGSGIPEEEHEKIFDRFYQAESTLFTEGGGAGIGLALTHDLVKLMHGTIDVESELGKGSKFTVKLPLGTRHLDESEYSVIQRAYQDDIPEEALDISPSKESALRRESPSKKDGHEENPLILIVEDNNEIRSMLAENMAPDFRVAEAINGSAGLKIATDQMPDLILTDLMMPGMDGLELCSSLKADLRTSHIPIIMLTGKAAMVDRLEGLESGADDYISKPFEIKEIKIRIKNLIISRQKLKEKFSCIISNNSHNVYASSMDQKFMQNVITVVEKQMSNEAFNVTELSRELNISRSTLSRKLNALTGMSPVEFIRTIRLQRAAALLKQQYGNVSQVALEVGFSNPSYFTRMFRQSYEIAPSKYAQTKIPSP